MADFVLPPGKILQNVLYEYLREYLACKGGCDLQHSKCTKLKK